MFVDDFLTIYPRLTKLCKMLRKVPHVFEPKKGQGKNKIYK